VSDVGPTVPVISLWDWLPAAFDPVLVLIAVTAGWKADQFGKVLIAAIAALGVSVLVSWQLTKLGIPWIAPIEPDKPTFFPVRVIAAVIWAGGAYATRCVVKR
jgi:hypothetical protein